MAAPLYGAAMMIAAPIPSHRRRICIAAGDGV